MVNPQEMGPVRDDGLNNLRAYLSEGVADIPQDPTEDVLRICHMMLLEDRNLLGSADGRELKTPLLTQIEHQKILNLLCNSEEGRNHLEGYLFNLAVSNSDGGSSSSPINHHQLKAIGDAIFEINGSDGSILKYRFGKVLDKLKDQSREIGEPNLWSVDETITAYKDANFPPPPPQSKYTLLDRSHRQSSESFIGFSGFSIPSGLKTGGSSEGSNIEVDENTLVINDATNLYAILSSLDSEKKEAFIKDIWNEAITSEKVVFAKRVVSVLLADDDGMNFIKDPSNVKSFLRVVGGIEEVKKVLSSTEVISIPENIKSDSEFSAAKDIIKKQLYNKQEFYKLLEKLEGNTFNGEPSKGYKPINQNISYRSQFKELEGEISETYKPLGFISRWGPRKLIRFIDWSKPKLYGKNFEAKAMNANSFKDLHRLLDDYNEQDAFIVDPTWKNTGKTIIGSALRDNLLLGENQPIIDFLEMAKESDVVVFRPDENISVSLYHHCMIELMEAYPLANNPEKGIIDENLAVLLNIQSNNIADSNVLSAILNKSVEVIKSVPPISAEETQKMFEVMYNILNTTNQDFLTTTNSSSLKIPIDAVTLAYSIVEPEGHFTRRVREEGYAFREFGSPDKSSLNNLKAFCKDKFLNHLVVEANRQFDMEGEQGEPYSYCTRSVSKLDLVRYNFGSVASNVYVQIRRTLFPQRGIYGITHGSPLLDPFKRALTFVDDRLRRLEPGKIRDTSINEEGRRLNAFLMDPRVHTALKCDILSGLMSSEEHKINNFFGRGTLVELKRWISNSHLYSLTNLGEFGAMVKVPGTPFLKNNRDSQGLMQKSWLFVGTVINSPFSAFRKFLESAESLVHGRLIKRYREKVSGNEDVKVFRLKVKSSGTKVQNSLFPGIYGRRVRYLLALELLSAYCKARGRDTSNPNKNKDLLFGDRDLKLVGNSYKRSFELFKEDKTRTRKIAPMFGKKRSIVTSLGLQTIADILDQELPLIVTPKSDRGRNAKTDIGALIKVIDLSTQQKRKNISKLIGQDDVLSSAKAV